jgi:hypothetical protein
MIYLIKSGTMIALTMMVSIRINTRLKVLISFNSINATPNKITPWKARIFM